MKKYYIICLFLLTLVGFTSWGGRTDRVDAAYDEAIDEAVFEGEPDSYDGHDIEPLESESEPEYYNPEEYQFGDSGSWFGSHLFLSFVLTFLGVALIWFIAKPIRSNAPLYSRIIGHFLFRTIWILPISIAIYFVEYIIFMGWGRFFDYLVDGIYVLIGLFLIGGFICWGVSKGGFETTGKSRGGNHDTRRRVCSCCRYHYAGQCTKYPGGNPPSFVNGECPEWDSL